MKTLTASLIALAACLGTSAAVDAASATGNSTSRLGGVWQATDPRPLLTPADGGMLPFRPAALAVYRKHIASRRNGDASFDLTSRCSSPGIPRILFLPYAFEIHERADEIVFLFEFNHLFRQVIMDGSRSEALYPMAMGFATGHWQGDTLNIITRSRNGKTLLDDAIPNSESLKVTERLRRTEDLIEDRVTIEDPKVFTRPWTAVVHYALQKERKIMEDVCLDRVAADRPPIQWQPTK